MTCPHCSKPYTFNMNCRNCQIKWLRMVGRAQAHQWLKAYRAEHGEAEMLKLIDEAKSDGR